MFGSGVLDVAIGVVFVYLLLSLIVTAIQELIETVIKLRAAHLARAIEKLLGPTQASAFFDHVLITALSPDKWFGDGTRKPSYIPSRTFAATVVDLIAPAVTSTERTIEQVRSGIDRIGDGAVGKSLTVLLAASENKLAIFEASLETWFNDQMDRVSGWYKRKVQLLILIIALVITIGMNADTLLLVKTLSSDAVLRTALVAQAQEQAKQPPTKADAANARPGAQDAAKEIEERLTATDAGIRKVQGLGLPLKFAWWQSPPKDFQLLEAIPGWLLTAFAISLGAPFWFDILKKVVSIRASGQAPDEKSPEKEDSP